VVATVSDQSERALELGRAVEASMAPAAPWVKRSAQSAQYFGLIYRVGGFDQIRRMWSVAKARADDSQDPNLSDMYLDMVYAHAAFVHGDLPVARRIFEATFQLAERAFGFSSTGAA
jgi:LuxR family maltose regulon positive regulatory protein